MIYDIVCHFQHSR